MILTKSVRRWLLIGLAAITLAPALPAAIPPAESLLPADTLLLLTAPDCAAVRKDNGQSSLWQMWNDPVMRPFQDKFMVKWREQFTGPIEQDLGLSLAQLLDLPQGQLTVAVTCNGWDGVDATQSAGLILLLDASDRSEVLKTNLAAWQKKWAADGKGLRQETIHGIRLTVVPLASNDVPPIVSALLPTQTQVQSLANSGKPGHTGEMVIGQYESLLVAGNSVKALEPVLSRLTGSSAPCLADNEIFASDRASQFRNSPDYYSWFNAHEVFGIIAKIPAPDANTATPSLLPRMSPALVLNACGLMGLKSVSVAHFEAHDGSLTTLYLSAPEADRQGLLKMMATDATDASPPAFVPADTMKFWRWRLESQAAWKELQKMVAQISPMALGTLNGAIDTVNAMAQQKNPAFDFRKDLIGNLGSDWVDYNKVPTGTTLTELNQSRGVFFLASANPTATLQAIKTALGLYAPQTSAPEPRDFQGHLIHTLKLQPQSALVTTKVKAELYCSTGNGYLAMSTDAATLEEYLRSAANPPKPLSQLPGLMDAAQQIGGMGTGLFGYEDHRQEMRLTFSTLKQSTNGEQFLTMLPKGFADWIDFSLLPDYDAVDKYFYFSVFNGTTSAEGITYKSYYPRPPKLN